MAGTRSSVKSASCKSIAYYVAFLHPSVTLTNPTDFLHNILNTCSANWGSDSSGKWNCCLVIPACSDGSGSSYSNIHTLPEHCTAHRHISSCTDGPGSSYSNTHTLPEHCTAQRHISSCSDGPGSSYSNIQTLPEHCTAQRQIQTTPVIWIEHTHYDLHYGRVIWISRWLQEGLTLRLSDTTNNRLPFQLYLLQWQQDIVQRWISTPFKSADWGLNGCEAIQVITGCKQN